MLGIPTKFNIFKLKFVEQNEIKILKEFSHHLIMLNFFFENIFFNFLLPNTDK